MSTTTAPLRSETHPISGAVYTAIGDGLIRVEDKAKGKSGLFRFDGTWIEGSLTHADLHLLGYVGGPDLPPGMDLPWVTMPALADDKPAFAAALAEQAASRPQRPKIIGKYVGDPGMDTPEGPRSSAHIPHAAFIAAERRPDLLPDVYKLSRPVPGGPEKVATARYFDKRYHDLEVEHIWKKCWQMVCREDDIPEAGDFWLYEIAHLQYLVVRQADGGIKAHVNACLHRGRQLRDCHGKHATEFRCPYHGWQWNIDGSLRMITAEWDFAGVRDDVSQLPGAKVAVWEGFVFINPDPDSISFEEYAGPEMLAHYRKAKLGNRYKQADVTKVIRANWKLVQEAFLEGYHSLATHPQLLLYGSECADLRFDNFGNWSRLGHMSMSGACPHRGSVLSEAQAIEGYHQVADGMREALRPLIGDEVEQYCDAELNEQGFNNLFPNTSPWGGWARVVYNFRPNGDNPDEALMRVQFLAPWPEGKPKPAPAKQTFLSADQFWTEAPELVSFAKIFDQDCNNLPQTQRGVKTKQPPYVWISGYQESIIRAFHRNY
ncbi:MAG: Rieske 2Fe-2S domain-containing protein, partial [Sphingomonadales bacterium]|nr:Rieske 2Fe-2S domain-containing protein [Sphingomonadales bacterium]